MWADARRGKVDKHLYLRAARIASPCELAHLDVVRIVRTLRAPLTQADSYWQSMFVRRRKKQLGPVPEKYLGLDKANDLAFARAAGVPAVETLYEGPWEEMPRDLTHVVIKPSLGSGSKGAFYVFDCAFASVGRNAAVADWDAVEALARKQLNLTSLAGTQWQVQTMVTRGGKPARDMKFYAFYGEIGIIQEVARYPVAQYEYYTDDSRVADFGRAHEPRFSDPGERTVDKGALDAAQLDVVRALSVQIPAPFMRLDFLLGDEGLVFTEFSASPGMGHTLAPAHDARLGAMFHGAEIRLVNDLLGGKTFDAYHRFLEQRRAPHAT